MSWVHMVTVIIIQNVVPNISETRYCNAQSGLNLCSCRIHGVCSLNCFGNHRCYGLNGINFALKCMAGYPCNIHCNSIGDINACNNAIIDASTATDVNILCENSKSCQNMQVKCGTGRCTVICSNSQFSGQQCDGLTLNCALDICTIECQPGFNGFTTCNNIDVNINPLTRGFQCIRPGINNQECNVIDQMVGPPFIIPTAFPSKLPTPTPTYMPTKTPTPNPTSNPSRNPTFKPTIDPTLSTLVPSNHPTLYPINAPTSDPTTDPSYDPTSDPTYNPTSDPTHVPTTDPSIDPTSDPTTDPTQKPTKNPTNNPTSGPTSDPTKDPTFSSRNNPTIYTTNNPTTNDIVVIIHDERQQSHDSHRASHYGLLWYLGISSTIIIICIIQTVLLCLCLYRLKHSNKSDDNDYDQEVIANNLAFHITKQRPSILYPDDEESSASGDDNNDFIDKEKEYLDMDDECIYDGTVTSPRPTTIIPRI